MTNAFAPVLFEKFVPGPALQRRLDEAAAAAKPRIVQGEVTYSANDIATTLMHQRDRNGIARKAGYVDHSDMVEKTGRSTPNKPAPKTAGKAKSSVFDIDSEKLQNQYAELCKLAGVDAGRKAMHLFEVSSISKIPLKRRVEFSDFLADSIDTAKAKQTSGTTITIKGKQASGATITGVAPRKVDDAPQLENSIDTVRGLLIQLARRYGKQDVKDLLARLSCKTLLEVNPSDYCWLTHRAAAMLAEPVQPEVPFEF